MSYTAVYACSNAVKLALFVHLCTAYWATHAVLLASTTLVVFGFLAASALYLNALLHVPAERLELLQDPTFLAQALAAQDLADLGYSDQASSASGDEEGGRGGSGGARFRSRAAQRRSDATLHVASRAALEMVPLPPPEPPQLGPNGRPMVKGIAAVRKERRRQLEKKFAKMDARHDRAQEAKIKDKKSGVDTSTESNKDEGE